MFEQHRAISVATSTPNRLKPLSESASRCTLTVTESSSGFVDERICHFEIEATSLSSSHSVRYDSLGRNSAALQYKAAASAMSWGTPTPCLYIPPRVAKAGAKSCSAALRYQAIAFGGIPRDVRAEFVAESEQPLRVGITRRGFGA